MLTHLKENEDTPVSILDIGINWRVVKSGLTEALRELYKGNKKIRVDNPQFYTEADGDWGYNIPYYISDK